MTMPSTAAAIAAAQDTDLTERLVIIAAVAGVEGDPRQWIYANRERLAVAAVDDNGATVASVYEYAVATYQPAPRPGEDPAKVTDAHLLAAVRAVAGIES